MPGSSPNPEAGRRLREARERLGLSIRKVERLSRALADRRQNQEYYISHAWLSEIERGELPPGIYKIFTLVTLYNLPLDEVLGFFGFNVADIGREQMGLALPHTHLIGASEAQTTPVRELMPEARLEKTDLLSRMFSGYRSLATDLFPKSDPFSAVYGYIGTRDLTLFPLIRPGSFVEIDPAQRKIERGHWSSAFERPIYFVELRDGYACSWCQERQASLLLIPHPESPSQVREVRYPGEAEVIGRVIAVNMRIAQSRERSLAFLRT
jgi:transcriptional regulator with XRE-family HTH domain